MFLEETGEPEGNLPWTWTLPTNPNLSSELDYRYLDTNSKQQPSKFQFLIALVYVPGNNSSIIEWRCGSLSRVLKTLQHKSTAGFCRNPADKKKKRHLVTPCGCGKIFIFSLPNSSLKSQIPQIILLEVE